MHGIVGELSAVELTVVDHTIHIWSVTLSLIPSTRRFFKPASVSEEPGVHFGLGLECYVQWSSPIRRLTDLQVSKRVVLRLLCVTSSIDLTSISPVLNAGSCCIETIPKKETSQCNAVEGTSNTIWDNKYGLGIWHLWNTETFSRMWRCNNCQWMYFAQRSRSHWLQLWSRNYIRSTSHPIIVDQLLDVWVHPKKGGREQGWSHVWMHRPWLCEQGTESIRDILIWTWIGASISIRDGKAGRRETIMVKGGIGESSFGVAIILVGFQEWRYSRAINLSTRCMITDSTADSSHTSNATTEERLRTAHNLSQQTSTN